MRHTPREKLLHVLEAMPNEAFGWLLNAILHNIWPDGTGGFTLESRTAIRKAQEAAQVLFDAQVEKEK